MLLVPELTATPSSPGTESMIRIHTAFAWRQRGPQRRYNLIVRSRRSAYAYLSANSSPLHSSS